MAAVTTRKGKEIETGRLTGGASPSQAEAKNVSWGYNPSTLAAAATDVALFQEGAEARVAGTSSQVTTTNSNDTYQVTATITATGTRTVAEVGLNDATTQPAQAAVAAGGVVGSAVSTTLNTAATYTPGNNVWIQIRTEVMKITAGSGSTALTVTRGQNGSSAISSIAATDPVTAGNVPGSTVTTGGSWLLHADHSSDGVNSGDSIAYTVQVQFT